MKKNIAIIAGGYSKEWEVSIKSAKTIYDNLPSDKYNKHTVIINKKGWFLQGDENATINKNDFSITVNGIKIKFDCAYITIHGTPGEDGKLQGYFDMIGISYTTANQLATTLTFNKWTCNQVLLKNGVQCSNSIILRNKKEVINELAIVTEIGLPCFVKPNAGGSSFGITKVKEKSQLLSAIKSAFDEGEEVLIESFMAGREVTCGAYKYKGEIYTLPLTEIVSENDFFDYQAKYEGLSDEITPAPISKETTTKVKTLTKQIYKLLDLSGIIRIDYILKNNTPHVIEVNTTPGMSKESLIPQQVAYKKDLNLAQLLNWMVEEAINKKEL